MSVEPEELARAVTRTCRHCDARTLITLKFCTQCYVEFDEAADEDEVQPAVDDLPHISMPVAYRYSRWRRTSTSFGPLGRMAASILCVAPAAWFFQTLFPIGFVWLGTVCPLFLRSIWKRVRID